MPRTSNQTTANPRHHQQIAHIGRYAAMATGMALAVLLPAGQALAATAAPAAPPPPATSSGTTIANVDVGGAIVLSSLTPSFTLSGVPGDRPVDDHAVTMNVFTNNATGYNVTVQAENALMVGTGISGDTIPVSDLSVRETGGSGPFLPLSSTAPVQVYNQTTRSAAAPGDALSNDYEFNTPIPDVVNDTYSDTLDYVATTNP
jgi:hypothetical protein